MPRNQSAGGTGLAQFCLHRQLAACEAFDSPQWREKCVVLFGVVWRHRAERSERRQAVWQASACSLRALVTMSKKPGADRKQPEDKKKEKDNSFASALSSAAKNALAAYTVRSSDDHSCSGTDSLDSTFWQRCHCQLENESTYVRYTRLLC